MSNFTVKTQKSVDSDIYLLDGRPHLDGGTLYKSKPIGAAFTTSGLPAASGLVDGLIAYNSDVKLLQVTLSGAWVNPSFE